MRTNQPNALDARISALKPGQSVELSRTDSGHVTVERSGNGRQLRFVRHTPQGSKVFKVGSF